MVHISDGLIHDIMFHITRGSFIILEVDVSSKLFFPTLAALKYKSPLESLLRTVCYF